MSKAVFVVISNTFQTKIYKSEYYARQKIWSNKYSKILKFDNEASATGFTQLLAKNPCP